MLLPLCSGIWIITTDCDQVYIRVSSVAEKEEREGKKEKDSSLAFFSYKKKERLLLWFHQGNIGVGYLYE